jgi:hypothetical protein
MIGPPQGVIQRTAIMADALDQAKKQRALLKQYVEEHMVKDTDWGTIPGTPKPSLWKAGAEKITSLYRCTAKFTVVERIERWGLQEDEAPLFHYQFKCRLVSRDTDKVVAEGVGSANSMERKYARQDPYTIANTILKMAKKRSLVDAAIALGCCSDLFTQDLEDLNGNGHQEKAVGPAHGGARAPKAAPAGHPPGDFKLGWDLEKPRGTVVHQTKGMWISELGVPALKFAENRWSWLAKETQDWKKRANYQAQLAVIQSELKRRESNLESTDEPWPTEEEK